jgi:hypothetical protein
MTLRLTETDISKMDEALSIILDKGRLVNVHVIQKELSIDKENAQFILNKVCEFGHNLEILISQKFSDGDHSIVRIKKAELTRFIDSGGFQKHFTPKDTISTHQTIINNSGDGSLINTGDNPRISANINISKGNISHLEKQLLDVGITNEDIAKLKEIINIEQPNPDSKKFGIKVNNWMTEMYGKALNGTWQITAGAAGQILYDVLNKYYFTS